MDSNFCVPRNSPRVPYRALAMAGCQSGEVSSLSQTGAYLRTRARLALGSWLEVSFQLPDGTEVHAWGEVRRVDRRMTEHGAGIRFLRIGHEALAAIARLCRRVGAEV